MSEPWVPAVSGSRAPTAQSPPGKDVDGPVRDRFASRPFCVSAASAPGGSRTPNLLIRSQMLYPLSYRRPMEKHTGRAQPDSSEASARTRPSRASGRPGQTSPTSGIRHAKPQVSDGRNAAEAGAANHSVGIGAVSVGIVDRSSLRSIRSTWTPRYASAV